MNKTPILIITAIVLLGGAFWAWQAGFLSPVKPVAVPDGIILFYGQGCPHCKNVDDFVAANNIASKVKFSHLEVWYNKTNQVIISKVVKKCGITSDSVGVPLLYDGKSKCYEGDADVINFFKNATGIK